MTDLAAGMSPGDAAEDAGSLIITRFFAAPPEAVFAAWTEPSRMAEWWGPVNCTATFCELDARVGGVWRAGMVSAEGNEHICGGTYTEVTPPERLAFSFAWETGEISGHEMSIVMEFHARDGGTEMRFTQTGFPTTSSRVSHEDGWTSSFVSLEQYLAK